MAVKFQSSRRQPAPVPAKLHPQSRRGNSPSLVRQKMRKEAAPTARRSYRAKLAEPGARGNGGEISIFAPPAITRNGDGCRREDMRSCRLMKTYIHVQKRL